MHVCKHSDQYIENCSGYIKLTKLVELYSHTLEGCNSKSIENFRLKLCYGIFKSKGHQNIKKINKFFFQNTSHLALKKY